MPLSFPVSHDPAGARGDRSDPWAELRRYEQAKADGTAPEASFDDLLDVINPLQHIPIVSTIYREITGDTIQGAARIVGGGLYGGVGGLVGGLVNAISEEATGSDLGDHAMVAMGLSEDTPADDRAPADSVQLAEADGTPGTAPDTARPPGAADAATAPAAQATPTAAAEPRSAGEDAALAAGGGALTGLAALKAFARDTGQAAAAAQADRTLADRPQGGRRLANETPANPGANPAPGQHAAENRSAAELQASQQAAAADRTPAMATTAPSQFMALGDRGALINHRARTNPAALAAESEPLGHRRLQGDPRAVPTPATAPSGEVASSPAVGAAPPAGGARPDAAAARGDLAERMMRALNKYEALRRDQ